MSSIPKSFFVGVHFIPWREPQIIHGAGRLRELPNLGFFAKAIGAVPAELDNHEASKLFIMQIRELNRAMGIPEHLDVIQNEDIPTLAKSASKEANPLYPVPKILNAKELETLYRIVKGTKL